MLYYTQGMQITRNIKPAIVEDRGIINNLLDTDKPIHSILWITSKAGSIPSNHYQKKDSHYCYINSGKAEWHEKPVEDCTEEVEILGPGDMVFTPPMTVHAVR